MAQCPDAKYRDGEKAIADAKKAMAFFAPADWHCHEALAAAYAEAGSFEEAVRWQEQALADAAYPNRDDGQRRLDLYRKKQPYRLP